MEINHIGTEEIKTKRLVLRRFHENDAKEIFEEFAKSNEDGIIFTTTWDFDSKEDWNMMYRFINIFKKNNAEIYIVELESSLEERLKRNKTENRLENKASKRNLEWSEKDLLKSVEKYRFNSRENEIQEKNYIKIDNTNISADIVAKTIKEKFKL